MNEERNIIVAIRDPESGQHAVRRAIGIADPAKHKLHLVHATRSAAMERTFELMNWTAEWGPHAAGSEAQRHAWLPLLAQTLERAGYRAAYEVLDGRPDAVIPEYGRSIGADLIVLSEPRGGQARVFFLGSTSLRILRHGSCPVLVARGQQEARYQRVLIAVDNDESSWHVANVARDWIPEAADVHLVHAFRISGEGQMRVEGVPENEIEKLRGAVRAQIENELEKYREIYKSGTIHLVHGFPESRILETIGAVDADLVVIGKHRQSQADERLIGSVAQFLLYACERDVLLVP
jgi:nucleotide-binding universal stress UspA family protein